MEFQTLKNRFESARRNLEDQFLNQTMETRRFIRELSDLSDWVVMAAWQMAAQKTGFSDARGFAIIAVGGSGRAEMAPYSDLDLMFLRANSAPQALYDTIEACLYVLWDLKIKIGHATRSQNDAISLAKSDLTIRTSLLEARHIMGDAKLTDQLTTRLQNEVFSKSNSEFIERKLEERTRRHHKHGGARYVLEPNIKEGKGGLRDLQTLFWITKHISTVSDPEEMIALGYFSKAEFSRFWEAETFLWTVRCHLHLLLGRATEVLNFEHQIDVSERMGFQGDTARRGVEYFMQSFFRHATTVGEVTRIFLVALEAQHVKSRPSFRQRLQQMLPGMAQGAQLPPSPSYQIEHGRLNLSDVEAFLDDPLNILRLFEEALHSDVLIHPEAMRVVSANLHLIDDALREKPEAQRIFQDLLLTHGNPERGLRRMNEIGVLGEFIPEFKRIVAMMQFNIYHHYTVDEHTIQCISHLAQIENGTLKEEQPLAATILNKGVNRVALYFGLLLHDIGKGQPEAHEIVGGALAKQIAPRLGLSEKDTETVVWLVENHLVMSDVAQKRDISDPRTIANFAGIVRTQARLDLLTVLTICDILGVGPNTLTSWKAQLLKDLYHATRTHLIVGAPEDAIGAAVEAAKLALAPLIKDWPEEARLRELSRHYQSYWIGFDTDTHYVIAQLLERLSVNEIEIDASHDQLRNVTRIAFVVQDHPGTFARFAGALALKGTNVLDARTYTSSDGFATAAFWVSDQLGQPISDQKLARLKTTIMQTLKGEIIARDEMKSHDIIKKSERDFKVPTEITFDNLGSDLCTIIEVDTRDRPGLLFDLLRTLTALNLQIVSSTVATYGAQAVDVFYVKDLFGLKIHSEKKRSAISEKLREAIDSGAKRALTT